MSDKKFQRFGRYLILDHLVDGGMATISRARFLGEEAGKIIAIKMIQSQYSKDPAFKQMFMDELKVAFGLLHPNIAQTYDYGQIDNQLYTAMEYVDGANLKQFLDRLKARNYVFPVEISVYITSQVCQGLHYAHTFTDKLTQKKSNIIHRDISPHNIMLTYDGAVKIIDFGIAKADTNSDATQTGTIKGKLSYLAPEYLEGEQLDHRYDQFAVGITLWELLCSRKLFTAANDIAVLKQIQACKVPPPSSINPNVPKELDEIILKSLSKDRNNRFEDMDKFNRALVKFLYQKYPDFNPSDLKYFSEQLFKEEIAKDRTTLASYGKMDIKPYLEDMKNEGSSSNSNGANVEVASSGPDKTKLKEDVEFELNPEATNTRMIKLEGEAGVTSLESDGQEKTSIRRRQERTQKRDLQKTGKGAKTSTSIRMKKQQKSEGGSKKMLIAIAAVAAFAVLKPQMFKELTGVDINKYLGNNNQARQAASNNTAAPSQPVYDDVNTTAKVLLNGVPSLAEVYVDGVATNYGISGLDVKVGKSTQIRVTLEGHSPYVVNVNPSTPDDVQRITVPQLQEERVGLLTTSLNYRTGSVMKININGEVVEQKLPVKNMRIPAGVYEAIIMDPELGTEKKVQFEIQENKRQFLD
jgi:serine/threonine protein kinase